MGAPGRVVISGSSGLVGSALTESLRTDGVEVVRLVRAAPRAADEVQWSPGTKLDPAVLEGAAAVVNLNGASIGKLPWGAKYRRELLTSRVEPTRTLAGALRALDAQNPGSVPHFVSASAVGFYGHRPGEVLTEHSVLGSTFLAQLSAKWEASARAAGAASRVALIRTAPIIHERGVLKPLVALTKAGVSGPLGRGTQVWPWISLGDEVRAIRHVIDAGLQGPVNLTGPERASANDIGRAIARELGKPFLVPAPAFALRLGLGRDAADSLLLADADVRPTALLESGFTFEHGTADAAVSAALRR